MCLWVWVNVYMCVQLKARQLILFHNRLFSMPHYPSSLLLPSSLPVLSQAWYNKKKHPACHRPALPFQLFVDRLRLWIFSTHLCPVVQSHRSGLNSIPSQTGGWTQRQTGGKQVTPQNVQESWKVKTVSPLRFIHWIVHSVCSWQLVSRGECLCSATGRKTRRRCQNISAWWKPGRWKLQLCSWRLYSYQ